MMSPAISVAIINALCLREGCDVKLFETTQYSDEYDNKHIRMSELGAVRGNKDEEIKDMFYIKPKNQIIPDFLKCVSDYKPDIALMSVQEDVWGIATDLLDSIKNLDIPHIIGGILPISDPEYVINHELVKQICIYEGERVVICDDLLATGGTAKAAAKLVERIGAKVAGFAFIIELTDLDGIKEINNYKTVSLVQY